MASKRSPRKRAFPTASLVPTEEKPAVDRRKTKRPKLAVQPQDSEKVTKRNAIDNEDDEVDYEEEKNEDPYGTSGTNSGAAAAVNTGATVKEAVSSSSVKFPVTSAHKPSRGQNWLNHISGTVIASCLRQAIEQSVDPRTSLSSVNWSKWAPTAISASELQKVWFYINRQYPSENLEDILSSLSVLSSVNSEALSREHTKAKYQHLAPKLPQSSYMIFYQKKCHKLMKKNPDMKQTVIAKKLGQIWREMDAEEKEKYNKIYLKNKEIYMEEMKAFHEQFPDAVIPKTKSTKGKAQPQEISKEMIRSWIESKDLQQLKKIMPKKPASPYMQFCKEKRTTLHERYPDLHPNQITVKLGERWRSMSDGHKKKYHDIHDALLEKYKQELKEFCKENPGVKKLLNVKKKKGEVKKPDSVSHEEESENDDEASVNGAADTGDKKAKTKGTKGTEEVVDSESESSSDDDEASSSE